MVGVKLGGLKAQLGAAGRHKVVRQQYSHVLQQDVTKSAGGGVREA